MLLISSFYIQIIIIHHYYGTRVCLIDAVNGKSALSRGLKFSIFGQPFE